MPDEFIDQLASVFSANASALVLDGPATVDAHFNTDPRRNAASVHLSYPLPKDAAVGWFYNEVTAVEDPARRLVPAGLPFTFAADFFADFAMLSLLRCHDF